MNGVRRPLSLTFSFTVSFLNGATRCRFLCQGCCVGMFFSCRQRIEVREAGESAQALGKVGAVVFDVGRPCERGLGPRCLLQEDLGSTWPAPPLARFLCSCRSWPRRSPAPWSSWGRLRSSAGGRICEREFGCWAVLGLSELVFILDNFHAKGFSEERNV